MKIKNLTATPFLLSILFILFLLLPIQTKSKSFKLNQFSIPNQEEQVTLTTKSEVEDFKSTTIALDSTIQMTVLKGEVSISLDSSVSSCFSYKSITKKESYRFEVKTGGFLVFLKYYNYYNQVGGLKSCLGNKLLKITLFPMSVVKVFNLSASQLKSNEINEEFFKLNDEDENEEDDMKAKESLWRSSMKIPFEGKVKTKPKIKKTIHKSYNYDLVIDENEISHFRQVHLDSQNYRRKVHQAVELKTDPILQEYAQAYTEWLIKYRDCQLITDNHSPKALYTGYNKFYSEENLYQNAKGIDVFGEEYWNWVLTSYEKFGENLSIVESNDGKVNCDGFSFSNNYYDEIIEYYSANPNGNPDHNSSDGGHFTQLVWKKSEYIGIGFAKCFNKRRQLYSCFTVSSYYKTGNGYKEYSDNVFLPGKSDLDMIFTEINERRVKNYR